MWGSQNAIVTNSRASRVLISSVNIKLIILSWGLPSLTDWKSAVLNNTKRT